MSPDTDAPLPQLSHAYAGAEWLDQNLACARESGRGRSKIAKTVSPFGRLVADLLGLVWRGLYHLPSAALERVDWSDKQLVSIGIDGDLATHDYSELTQLVVLAHDLCIRLAISANGPRGLRLVFHRRWGRDGDYSLRHPDLEVHAEVIRSGYVVTPATDVSGSFNRWGVSVDDDACTYTECNERPAEGLYVERDAAGELLRVSSVCAPCGRKLEAANRRAQMRPVDSPGPGDE